MYEEAREKIALEVVNDRNTMQAFLNGSIKDVVDVPSGLERAEIILENLLTPSQLKEWKAGGELGVICRDQSLPHIPEREWGQLPKIRYGQKSMWNGGFRRVVGKEG